jgi:two-component system phosphate regulon response regulator PhoB
MAHERILVVEDEGDLREVLAYNLTRERFRVSTARDGLTAMDLVRKVRPDLVLLDLMLPDLDGIEVCRRIRADDALARTPIIMLTAKSEESDVVLGLGVGADDYVTKPFSVKEVIARVQAVLRRGAPEEGEGAPRAVERGPLRIDPERHEVWVRGESVRFTATEFSLLHFLARRPGRVWSRDDLLRRVLGEDVIRIDRNIDVHIRAIRKKLGGERDLIETVRGVGYRFADAAG